MTSTDHAPLDNAVLEVVARLCGPRNRPVRWAVIRARIPARHGLLDESLVRLWTTHRLNAFKVDGRTYVSLPDELDDWIAAVERANGTPRRLLVLDRTA